MRILIADDHDMVLETIAAFIGAEIDADVQTAGDFDTALTCMQDDDKFDLVMLDYNMPGMNGLEGLARARAATPGGKVAIISGNLSNRLAQKILNEGAVGFLPKTMGSKSLVNAVRFMAAGEKYVPASLLESDTTTGLHPLAHLITSREMDVLELLCHGQSNKEIALTLGLQEVTIKLHVRSLCKKLDVKNRTQAALAAKNEGLF